MAEQVNANSNLKVVSNRATNGQKFGELVQRLFKARGMNQYQFAEKTGYSQSYISRVEGGERPFSEKLCQAFAEALKVDVSALRAAYDEIQDGSDKSLYEHFKLLMRPENSEICPGVLIRQLQQSDLLKLFSEEANGEFVDRGEAEDCAIEHFNPAFVRPTSYDTVVGGYIRYDDHGNEEAIQVDESVKIDPGQSVIAIVREHIMLPSRIEAEIHPASNIGRKHLIVSHGPVIDPGWSGYLKVSVFNPTTVVKEIRTDEPFLTLRFWMAVEDSR